MHFQLITLVATSFGAVTAITCSQIGWSTSNSRVGSTTRGKDPLIRKDNRKSWKPKIVLLAFSLSRRAKLHSVPESPKRSSRQLQDRSKVPWTTTLMAVTRISCFGCHWWAKASNMYVQIHHYFWDHDSEAAEEPVIELPSAWYWYLRYHTLVTL
jgi:hypothetical protein